jgi:hypothetical protein
MNGYQLGENFSLPAPDPIQTVWAASTGGRTGNPPSVIEPPPRWLNLSNGIEVDRYATNPMVEYYRQLMPGASYVAAPPRMWVSGDLPVVTGSGVPPEILRWVPWWARHEAALTASRGRVLALIEEADHSDSAVDLLTSDGRAVFADYQSRVQTWASTLPAEPEQTPEDFSQLYGPGSQPAD